MSRATPFETLSLSIDGAVATIALDRPGRRNAMTVQMVHEFDAVVRQVVDRADIAVIVLTGRGGDFCVGADIAGAGSDGDMSHAALGPLFQAVTRLHEASQVSIAAIDGGCAGAGLSLAAACDFRFASDRAVFSTAFLNVATAGDFGAVWSLARIVGPVRAREMMFFSEKFGAAEALKVDLVSRLFTAADLGPETQHLAARLAAASPLALKTLKANFLSAERLSMAEFVEVEGARHVHVVAGDDVREAFAAFREKRPAVFRRPADDGELPS